MVHAHRNPTQIRQVSSRFHLTRLPALVSHVYLLISLAKPAPSGSTNTTRLCQGRLPPIPPSRETGCPQLHPAAVTTRRRRSLTSVRELRASWRTNTRWCTSHQSSAPLGT